MQDDTIPLGYCQCGCGQRTTISPQSHTRQGYVRGQPRRFVAGHQRRNARRWEERDCGYVTPCHVWLLTLHKLGYGVAYESATGRYRGAHIIAWERVNGPVPQGLELDHLCRNRACCNPAHLEAVTHTENMRRGASCKLTMETADTIRVLLADGWLGSDIAKAFEVSKSTVSLIRRGKVWA